MNLWVFVDPHSIKSSKNDHKKFLLIENRLESILKWQKSVTVAQLKNPAF